MIPYAISQDPDAGMIRVSQTGFWTPDIVDAYFRDLARYVRNTRSAGKAVRIISDRRECPVQSHETVERTVSHVAQILTPGDRVALIVQSSLVKLQLRRTYPDDIFQCFLSANAGEVWFSAF